MFINMHFLLCFSFILWQNCHHPLLELSFEGEKANTGARGTLQQEHRLCRLTQRRHKHTADEIKSKILQGWLYTHRHTYNSTGKRRRRTILRSVPSQLSLVPFSSYLHIVAQQFFRLPPHDLFYPYTPKTPFRFAPVGLLARTRKKKERDSAVVRINFKYYQNKRGTLLGGLYWSLHLWLLG